jgi:DNA-binding MarR family transcriptional regulator
MGQDDVLRILDNNPDELFDSTELRDILKINPSSVSQSLKRLRETDWLGYINFKDSRYYYYSLNSKRFRNIPRIIRIFSGVAGQDKQNILRYLHQEYGVELK